MLLCYYTRLTIITIVYNGSNSNHVNTNNKSFAARAQSKTRDLGCASPRDVALRRRDKSSGTLARPRRKGRGSCCMAASRSKDSRGKNRRVARFRRLGPPVASKRSPSRMLSGMTLKTGMSLAGRALEPQNQGYAHVINYVGEIRGHRIRACPRGPPSW